MTEMDVLCHVWRGAAQKRRWEAGPLAIKSVPAAAHACTYYLKSCDGWTIKVWKDNWVPNQGPLVEIQGLCPPFGSRGEDEISWKESPDAWQRIINNQTPPSFWNDPVNDWVISNLNQSSVAKSDWSVLFSLTIDGVWRARNDFIFRNILPNVDKVVFTFKKAFAKNLGDCSAVQAELWAIFLNLNVAHEKGFNAIFIESDSLLSVSLVCVVFIFALILVLT
ncbi:hypothetical protein JHK86_011640 [Glycine max]|nr:hypothetical protein JHK86_011640 [Glycine max]